ncbi:hypothetical protein D3C80_2083150 [compost metagenome]
MHCDLREPLFNSAENIRIVAERQIRVGAALHQNFRTVNSNGLGDLLVDGFIRKHIAFL